MLDAPLVRAPGRLPQVGHCAVHLLLHGLLAHVVVARGKLVVHLLHVFCRDVSLKRYQVNWTRQWRVQAWTVRKEGPATSSTTPCAVGPPCLLTSYFRQ